MVGARVTIVLLCSCSHKRLRCLLRHMGQGNLADEGLMYQCMEWDTSDMAPFVCMPSSCEGDNTINKSLSVPVS